MGNHLQNKAAIVTGSSKGIGYAIAQQLAAAGANVVISARNAEEVASAAETLNGEGGGRVIGVPCDVRDPEQVRRMIDRAVQEFGRVDVLVNNAGIGGFAPVDQISIEQWQRMLETNLHGAFYASHAAIPQMREGDGGWIINIGSLAGKNPFAGGAAYNASKFGLLGFSEAMMLDVRQDNIRVCCIMPGSVATYFNDHTPNEQDAWKIQPEDIARMVMDLLAYPDRALPSRIEIRPTRPKGK